MSDRPMKSLHLILLLSAALFGCSTYRHDLARCADVGMFDQPPAGCWCADGDYSCYETSRRAGLVDQALSLHIQSPEIGRRDITGDIGHVTIPSERGHPSPETLRWVQAPMDPEASHALACAWICFSGHAGQRPEECGC